MASEPAVELEPTFVGCFLGGAVGDALGAAVEFMSWPEIRRHYGHQGIDAYSEVYGRKGAITDDTQMALFTGEGLLRAVSANAAEAGPLADPVRAIHRSYLRWLHTQGHRSAHPEFDDALDGWLVRTPRLHSQRAPGNTCLGALGLPHAGSIEHPLNNSKGCGTVMRIAPVGLWGQEPFDLGCRVSALTHGHPTGYLSGGLLAVIIAYIVAGASVREAVEEALGMYRPQLGGELIGAVERALEFASDSAPTPQKVESLGEGWVAEEALAIGIYAALTAENFTQGVVVAVNHGGDSDSTGAIAGNILGTALGRTAVGEQWLEDLELRDEIIEIARDLAYAHAGRAVDSGRYPPH
jgi:ADP-ribosylglycohydrolase